MPIDVLRVNSGHMYTDFLSLNVFGCFSPHEYACRYVLFRVRCCPEVASSCVHGISRHSLTAPPPPGRLVSRLPPPLPSSLFPSSLSLRSLPRTFQTHESIFSVRTSTRRTATTAPTRKVCFQRVTAAEASPWSCGRSTRAAGRRMLSTRTLRRKPSNRWRRRRLLGRCKD